MGNLLQLIGKTNARNKNILLRARMVQLLKKKVKTATPDDVTKRLV